MSAGKVARNTAYLMSAFIGQKLLSFLYFAIVSRMVGVQGSGRYFVATAFTTLFSIFIDLGLANVLVREVAKAPERARQLLGSALALKIPLTLATMAAAVATAGLLGYPRLLFVMICVSTLVMALDGIHLAFYSVMRGRQNLRYEAVGVVTGQAVVIVSGLLFVTSGLPLPFLIVALLLGSAWNVLWSLWSLRRHFGISPSLSWDRGTVRFLWQAAAPFALAGIFSRVYSYIDSVMLSRLVPDESAVGLYGVASKVAFAFQFVPMSLAAAVYPAMSAFYKEDRGKLTSLLSSSLQYLLMLALPLAVGIGVLAEPVLRLVFGPEYVGAAGALRLLMASLVFAFLYWPAGSLLNASDRQATNTAVMGMTMVVNVAINAVLIPRIGLLGAAAAALTGNVALFGLSFFFASRLVAFPYAAFAWKALRIAAASAVMGAVVWLVALAAFMVIAIPVGAAAYAGLLIALRVVSAEDWRSMRAMLRQKPGASAASV